MTRCSVVLVLVVGCGPMVANNGTFTVGEPTTVAGSSEATSSDDDTTTGGASSSTVGDSTGDATTDTSSGTTGTTVDPDSTATTDATTDATTGGPVVPPMASANCQLDAHVEAELGQPELHIFGVYEGSGDHSMSAPATVHVDRPGEVYLVVASYESVTWTITAAEGTTISQVILSGYEGQFAEVPDGTMVLDRSGNNMPLSAAAYQWADPDTQSLALSVEGLTGAALTSFHGCYQGSSFTLE